MIYSPPRTPSPTAPLRTSDRADTPAGTLAVIGAVTAVTSALLIWVSRAVEPGVHYVSQLGAADMSVAPLFNLALLLLGGAAALVDRALRTARRSYVVGWSIGATLLVSGLCFATASVVTCSPGCPVPFTPGAQVQDTLHIAAAVTGFTTAVVAMGQVAALAGRRWMRLGSVVALSGVGGCALTGAMISLAGGDTVLGGNLEFVATTVAIGWFGVFGWQVAADERVPAQPASVGS